MLISYSYIHCFRNTTDNPDQRNAILCIKLEEKSIGSLETIRAITIPPSSFFFFSFVIESSHSVNER